MSLYSYKVYIISGGLSVYVFRVDKDTSVYMYSFNHTLHYEMLIREIIIDCNYAPNVLPRGNLT